MQAYDSVVVGADVDDVEFVDELDVIVGVVALVEVAVVVVAGVVVAVADAIDDDVVVVVAVGEVDVVAAVEIDCAQQWPYDESSRPVH